MAAKLHWINESFRKYEIEDLGCQLYISCEAGKIFKGGKKTPKNGRITSMIHCSKKSGRGTFNKKCNMVMNLNRVDIEFVSELVDQ